MSAYTLDQLQRKQFEDLLTCNTAFESSMVCAIGNMEIRKEAHELAKIRPLTTSEMVIAERAGYKSDQLG